MFSLKHNCLIAYFEFIGIHTFQPVNTLPHMNLRHPSCWWCIWTTWRPWMSYCKRRRRRSGRRSKLYKRKSIQRAGVVPVCSVILQGDWPPTGAAGSDVDQVPWYWLQQGMESFLRWDKNLAKNGESTFWQRPSPWFHKLVRPKLW